MGAAQSPENLREPTHTGSATLCISPSECDSATDNPKVRGHRISGQIRTGNRVDHQPRNERAQDRFGPSESCRQPSRRPTLGHNTDIDEDTAATMVRQPASSSTTAEREVSDEARVVQRCGGPRPVRGAPAPKILLPPVVTMTATLAASSTGRCPIDALADLTGCGSARAGSSHGFERCKE